MNSLSENRGRGSRSDDMLIGCNTSVTQTETRMTFGSSRNSESSGARSPPRDPLRILVPITDGCLILYAIIVIISLAMVALIVTMAIIKKYFTKSAFNSIWTDL